MLGKVVKLGSKRIAIASCRRAQSNGRLRKDSPLTPELKEFIDRAIVPGLVKQYLALTDLENDLAEKGSDAAHFVSSTATRKLRTVRP